MAFTNVWSDTVPSDDDDANTLGDSDRDIRLDVHERLNAIIGVAIATALADPLIAAGLSLTELRADLDSHNPIVSEYGVARTLVILGSDFEQDLASGANFIPPMGAPLSTVVAIVAKKGLTLPVGSIITNIDAYVHLNGGNVCTFTMVLYKKTLDAVSTTHTTAGTVTKSSAWTADVMATIPFASDLNETVVDGVGYGIRAAITPAGVTAYFHGVRIRYITPYLLPQLLSVTPSSGAQGTGPSIALVGANFAPSSTVQISGSGVTVGSLVVVDTENITCVFTIAGGATLGARTVTVTSPAGVSNSMPFTITA